MNNDTGRTDPSPTTRLPRRPDDTPRTCHHQRMGGRPTANVPAHTPMVPVPLSGVRPQHHHRVGVPAAVTGEPSRCTCGDEVHTTFGGPVGTTPVRSYVGDTLIAPKTSAKPSTTATTLGSVVAVRRSPNVRDVQQRGRRLLRLFSASVVSNRGLDVRMSRQSLHRGDVRTRVQQVADERPPQVMRRELRHTCPLRAPSQHEEQRLRRQSASYGSTAFVDGQE